MPTHTPPARDTLKYELEIAPANVFADICFFVELVTKERRPSVASLCCIANATSALQSERHEIGVPFRTFRRTLPVTDYRANFTLMRQDFAQQS